MLLPLVLACAEAPVSGHDAVLAALRDDSAPLEERLSLCGRAPDPDLAGDCALAVVSGPIRQGPALSASLCPEVPGEPWRAECWFVAAEAFYHHDQLDLAARACRNATPFGAECGQHLYQHPVRALVGSDVAAAWPERVQEARQLRSAWRARLGPEVEMDGRYWPLFFRTVFERAPELGEGACLQVGGDLERVCELAWREVAARQ